MSRLMVGVSGVRGIVGETLTAEVAEQFGQAFAMMLPAGATVCISGCPNGCVHPAVADIGLTGRVTKDSQGQRVEAFDILAEGGMGHDDRLAKTIATKVQTNDIVNTIKAFYNDQ